MSSTHFITSTGGYNSLQYATLQQRLKPRFWSYPYDHLVYKRTLNITPHMPVLLTGFPSDSFSQKDIWSQSNTICYNERKEVEPDKIVVSYNGSLEMLTKMPIDILYEIFTHVHPVDLLNLSRSARCLREMLLAEHARGVWRSSLLSVRGLPFCPSDLNEVLYASLAFDDWCQYCLAPKAENISWICRVRCCTNCIGKYFISEDELDLWIPEDVHLDKPEAIFPYIKLPKRDETTERNKPWYFLLTAKRYLKEIDDHDLANNEKALTIWREQKKELLFNRLTHAKQCDQWQTHWPYRRLARLGPSRLWEVLTIFVLALILLFLWRDKVFDVRGGL